MRPSEERLAERLATRPLYRLLGPVRTDVFDVTPAQRPRTTPRSAAHSARASDLAMPSAAERLKISLHPARLHRRSPDGQRNLQRTRSGQRAGPRLRTRLAGEGFAQEAPVPDARRDRRGAAHHRRRRGAHRQHGQHGVPPRPRPRARNLPPGRRGRSPAGHRGQPGSLDDLVGDALARPRRHLPQGRRPARRPVARHAERRHHAQPVEDRLSRRRSTPPAS